MVQVYTFGTLWLHRLYNNVISLTESIKVVQITIFNIYY